MESVRRSPLRVPVHVLGNVHRQTGTGWKWDCNYKGCLAYGVRLTVHESWSSVVEHWHHAHKAAGGKIKTTGGNDGARLAT